MARDSEKELLAELGVVAANPSDYEQALLAKAQRFADEKLLEQGQGEELAGAQIFLRENDPELYIGAKHVQESLKNLESEILAVTAARDAANLALTKSSEADASIGEDGNSRFLGQERMHLKLLDERLISLKKRRKALREKLKKFKVLRRGTEDAETGDVSNDREDTRSAAVVKNAESRRGKQKAVVLVEDDDFDAALDAASGFAVETEREKLIRKGVITPFSKVDGLEKRVRPSRGEGSSSVPSEDGELVKKSISNAVASMSALRNARPTTRLLDSSDLPKVDPPTREFRQLRTPFKRVVADEEKNKAVKSGVKRKRPQAERKWKKRIDYSSDESESGSRGTAKTESGVDEPVRTGRSKLRRLRLKHKATGDEDESGEGQENLEDGDDEEDQEADEQDVTFEGGLKIPGPIHSKLFDYQRTGVKWMWEIHCLRAGGIIGDEMGLGKTVQVIAFLAALHYSGMFKPSIVICPVTLLRQWKREFKTWYPHFETAILHDSAVRGRVKKAKTKRNESAEETTESGGNDQGSDSENEDASSGKGEDKWTSMINSIIRSESGVLITTYEQLRINRDKLLDIRWGYAVLDEGHRIRNPDAEVTLVCKQLQTVHRIIMTGAPIQNKLMELWSLFDYVFPGKLGVLPVFQSQFALPIQIGGYANATPLQVSTAYKCAVVLRDLVLPYMLRRMKADVNANLTKKTEHVLFCSLTEAQRSAYRAFLGSAEVEQIIDRQRNCLYGIDTLRKICNHPDLLEREHICGHADYGNPERSGKLKLVAQVLDLWKRQGHRVLLFTQTQQMLDIIQTFAEAKGYEYRRMDGSTAIRQRMALIDEFNESEHVFLFILTTKVGGLGTNLTGANRVIIFDPDWNPSTDVQARERAWRIGQKKDVTIYRLVTKGTIEEKIYHRQIFKHFLTDKVLKDPNQRRFFKAKDLRDLFVLQEDTSGDSKTETAVLFGDDVGSILSTDQAIQEASGVPQTESPDQKSTGGRDAASRGSNTKLKGKKSAGEEVEEEESRVLKDLFGANGIHSAMDHDAILAVSEKEKKLVDQEAARVAQRATDALLESRMLRCSDDIAVPTWTGRSGEAGAPAGRRFGATASRRSSTAAVPTVQTTTVTAHQRNAQVNGISVSSGRAAGLGIAGTSSSSADVLRRMQERQNGLVGISPSGQNLARTLGSSASASTSLQVSIVGTQGGANFHPSSSQPGGLSSSRFGRRIQGTGPASSASAVGDSGPDESRLQTSVQLENEGKGHATGDPTSLPMQVHGPRSSPPSSRGGVGIRDFQSLPKHVTLGLREQETLFAEIKSFIQRSGGSVPSATIVDHFKAYLRPKDVPLFKDLLKDAAKLQKDSDGVSRWVLRERPL